VERNLGPVPCDCSHCYRVVVHVPCERYVSFLFPRLMMKGAVCARAVLTSAEVPCRDKPGPVKGPCCMNQTRKRCKSKSRGSSLLVGPVETTGDERRRVRLCERESPMCCCGSDAPERICLNPRFRCGYQAWCLTCRSVEEGLVTKSFRQQNDYLQLQRVLLLSPADWGT
jgi:hypothetical protein